MRLDKASGRVADAEWIPSPNCDPRPDPDDISALIIHAISLPPDQFGGPHVAELFTNCLDPEGHPYFQEICELRVSAHFLILRDGHLIQFVPTHLRAWHAGESKLAGRTVVNDFSIGIELEGCDTRPFEPAQYQTLSVLSSVIQTSYPAITSERIVGHSDIAPGRKTDPGPHFDWPLFRQLLAGASVLIHKGI